MLFHNKFNKFDKTGARISDYIYQMTLYCFKSHFWHENVKILQSFTQCYDGHDYVTLPIYKVVYHFYCMTLYHYHRGHNLIKGNIILKKAKIIVSEVRKVAKIRNRYNQVTHLTQDTNGKNKNDPQKKHRLVMVSKIFLLEGSNLFHSDNLTFRSDVDQDILMFGLHERLLTYPCTIS